MNNYRKRELIILALTCYRNKFKKNSKCYKELNKILKEDYRPKGYTEAEIKKKYPNGLDF